VSLPVRTKLGLCDLLLDVDSAWEARTGPPGPFKVPGSEGRLDPSLLR
jgi:hypothetical protein